MMQKIQYNLFRADIYRILALGFTDPLKENFDKLQGILTDLLKDFSGFCADGEIKQLLEQMKIVIQDADLPSVEAEHNRLFATQVVCSPYEGSYHILERGAVLGDITAFYSAFHLTFLSKEGPPDAIKMELAFLSYMALKEVFALEHHYLNEVQTTFEAQQKFLLDHLGRWGNSFVSLLQAATSLPYYKILAKFLKGWLIRENEYFKINPVLLTNPLPQIYSEETQCEVR